MDREYHAGIDERANHVGDPDHRRGDSRAEGRGDHGWSGERSGGSQAGRSAGPIPADGQRTEASTPASAGAASAAAASLTGASARAASAGGLASAKSAPARWQRMVLALHSRPLSQSLLI